MYAKLLLLSLAVYLKCQPVLGQRQWISPSTTAQEMRNPVTWYRPYYQAAAEAYYNYFQNAREIRNQLWQQAYATGAFGGGGSNNSSGQIPSQNPYQIPNQFPNQFPNQG